MAVSREEVLQDWCDESWSALDEQVAEGLGLPTWQTPEVYRTRITEAFLSDPAVRKLDPRKPAQRGVLTQGFRRLALPKAEAYAIAAVQAAAHLTPRAFAAARRKYRVRDIPKAQGKRPARSQKADARNLELLSFVVERIIPFAQLLEPRRDSEKRDNRLLPGHRGPNVAVPREALADEWNQTHPHWPMSSGDVLMGQFNRAAGRPHLAREFLQQLKSEIDEVLSGFAEAAQAVASKFSQPVPLVFMKMILMMEAVVRTNAPREEQQQQRDRLTRRQLIARKAGATMAEYLEVEAKSGSLETPTHDPRDVPSFRLPLRPWFLEEARLRSEKESPPEKVKASRTSRPSR